MASKIFKIKKFYHQVIKANKLASFALLILLTGSIFLISTNLDQIQEFFVSASIGEAQLFFEPQTPTLPSDIPINVWINADKDIAFYKVNISFDQTSIRLTNEPDTSTSPLTRSIQSTSMSDANNTGVITFIFGLEPSKLGQISTQGFKVASLNFEPISTQSSSTELVFVESQIQLVDTDATQLNITTQASSMSLNPLPSPTPQVSPTISPTSPPASTPPPDSCSSCRFGFCDNKCDQRKEDATCADCQSINLSECTACFKEICDGRCNSNKEGVSCPDCQ